MIKGIKWLPKIIEGLDTFMDEHDYPDVESMHGIASRRAVRDYGHQFEKPRIHSSVNRDTCKNATSCTICIQTCFYEALSQADKKVGVHSDACIGCEMCPKPARSTRSTSRRRRRRNWHPAASIPFPRAASSRTSSRRSSFAA